MHPTFLFGSQAKIQRIYPKAARDLNDVAEIRNTISTTKAINIFFRESPKRKFSFKNNPLLCETRRRSKYKSIRIFCNKFEDIYFQLEEFSLHASGKTQHIYILSGYYFAVHIETHCAPVIASVRAWQNRPILAMQYWCNIVPPIMANIGSTLLAQYC